MASRASMSATSRPARTSKGQHGDPYHTHLILDGWACRYKPFPDGRRAIVALLLPGDLCDPFAFRRARMDHAIGALTPVTVARITPDQIGDAIRDRPAVEECLWREMLATTAIHREWIASVGRRSAIERLAHLFCELHLRLTRVGLADGATLPMPVTQPDLADALGQTSVHINRTLKELRTSGLVALRGRRLTIRDLGRADGAGAVRSGLPAARLSAAGETPRPGRRLVRGANLALGPRAADLSRTPFRRRADRQTMHIHLDALGGVAGDMFAAALLDAFPEHREGVRASIRAVDARIACAAHRAQRRHPARRALRRLGVPARSPGRRRTGTTRSPRAPDHHAPISAHHDHGQAARSCTPTDPGHGHRPWSEIRAALEAADLAPAVAGARARHLRPPRRRGGPGPRHRRSRRWRSTRSGPSTRSPTSWPPPT